MFFYYGRIILKYLVTTGHENLNSIQLSHEGVRWQSLLTVMKLQFGNFLTSWENIIYLELFLVSNFCYVLNVIFFLLDDSHCLNFMCQCFRTLCLFHLHRWCKQEEFYLFTPQNGQCVLMGRYIKFKCQGITKKKEYST
jgi:hypothetical protein